MAAELAQARLHARVLRHCPDIETVIVPGTSHLMHLDQPEAFTGAVRGAAGR